ncbi:hypothetical protein TWF730_004690 [Orbilia blumenaviensis]|uniref:Uncharacterized protein n=1 Tax=Orbilia blumenaviensis TaxID=1796055 RepID=A0AAV9TYK5_9PEZI
MVVPDVKFAASMNCGVSPAKASPKTSNIAATSYRDLKSYKHLYYHFADPFGKYEGLGANAGPNKAK